MRRMLLITLFASFGMAYAANKPTVKPTRLTNADSDDPNVLFKDNGNIVLYMGISPEARPSLPAAPTQDPDAYGPQEPDGDDDSQDGDDAAIHGSLKARIAAHSASQAKPR